MKQWKTKNDYSITCILSGRSNVFLLSGKEKNILVDTGTKRGWKKLNSRLKKLNLQRIDFLILTHTHFDHAENSAKLKRKYDLKVIVNKTEASFLEKGENIIPEGTNFITRFISSILAPIFLVKLNYEPCNPDILVDQILSLKDFGFNGYIVHTPGHTAGSQSVIVDEEIAMAGDTIFGIFPGSVFPPYADNVADMINSWGKLLETGCLVFLPSHGSSIGRNLLQKKFRKRAEVLCRDAAQATQQH